MHTDTKQVAIVLGLYNGATYLSEQIDSILNNTYPNFTLHIFDDGSTDNSAQIAMEYEQKNPEKIIYHKNKKNMGVVKNFLSGVNSLTADYYMFCDQDDVWCETKIEKSVACMMNLEQQKKETPLVLFGDTKVVDQNLKELSPSFQRQSKYNTQATDLPHLLMENKLIGCTVLFNHALKKLLTVFPDEIRMHDWWIALLGASFGMVHYLDLPLMLYRQHTNNVVGTISQKSYIKNRIATLRKQRNVLYDTCAQANAFLEVYRTSLSTEATKILTRFAQLPKMNFFKRRYTVLRYGYLKSGIVRNLGVLFVI